MKLGNLALLAISTALCLVVACKSTGFMSGNPQAVCRLSSLSGGKARGTVFFMQEADDILIEAEFDGLTPGIHGIHIHEHGDCGGEAGAAAGAHFNPNMGSHGGPGVAGNHEGDLGNIIADATGHARLTLRDKELQLAGSNSILGRSIVLHAGEDDMKSQPAGNSGARVSCGVIVSAQR